jgi:hypothetical protein
LDTSNYLGKWKQYLLTLWPKLFRIMQVHESINTFSGAPKVLLQQHKLMEVWTMGTFGRIWFGLVIVLGSGATQMAEGQSKVVRDVLWAWGNPEMTKPGQHTLTTFASASPAQRAALLGVPNVILAGPGLPNDDQQADAQTREVADSPQVIWEIAPDGGEGSPFVYTQRIAQVRKLVDKYPKIKGVLLDDMSTVAVDKGFKPEHIRQIRQLMDGKLAAEKLWGVLYTMSFNRPKVNDYIKELDGISLWVWHAKDLAHLENYVAHCEKEFPGKPIMLGLYMYDYGDGRRMPMDLLKQQCETALKLAHAGRIQGIVFLTVDDDAEAVGWVADWIKRVGDQKLGSPKAISEDSPSANTTGRNGGASAFTLTSFAGNSDESVNHLKIGDGSGWHFTSGPWTEAADGVISPPNKGNLHSRAFFTKGSFGDFTAEFEVNCNYRENGAGGAGLVFRATDATHFYAVYCPWGGQQLRANHFWISIVKADGNGYLRNLKMACVPGVPSESDRWYKVRLEAKGPKMTVWVNGHQALEASDDSYKSGAAGMLGYGWYFFRNIGIAGQQMPMAAWNTKLQVPVHHFEVGLSSAEMPSCCIAPNGEVILAAGDKLVRSKDKGRTWGAPETLPGKLGKVTDYGNTMFRTAKGRLIVQLYRGAAETKKPAPEISVAESPDNGATWSDPVPAKVAEGWPDIPANLVPYGPLLETEDGTLLRFLLGSAKESSKFTNVVTWGSVHCKAYVIRSTDGAKSWSAPIELDQPAWTGVARGSIIGTLDLTEPTGVAIGNRVTVVIRPVYSQTMWQCWSENAGATWDAAARATFPGYAQSMARTKSGTILTAHRYPHYCVNISRDGGLNWDDGMIIDYPNWAMGNLVEVEPDVLLCTYMNASRDRPLLAQLLRITPNGIEPFK